MTTDEREVFDQLRTSLFEAQDIAVKLSGPSNRNTHNREYCRGRADALREAITALDACLAVVCDAPETTYDPHCQQAASSNAYNVAWQGNQDAGQTVRRGEP